MAMYYYARKLQKSARKIKATPQQTPITTANGSVPVCATLSSTVIVSGQGAGVGCTSQPHQLNTSSLSPGSSDSGQQQLQQLQLSIQNLGLGTSSSGGAGSGSNNTVPVGTIPHQQSAQYARPPISSCLSTPGVPNPLLQKEWEKTGLVFQESSLVSGSLDALIGHLVPTPEYYPDRAFVFAFLLSSRLHIRPHELLGTVFRLAFNVPENSSSSNYQTEDQIKIVGHMVQLLGEWAELFPYDFRDDKMMAHVRAITQKCVSIDPPVRKDVSLLLTSLLSRLTALEKYEAFLHKVAVETPPEGQATTAPSILAICPDPNLLAEQLTHVELERLSHIGPEEFVQAFVKEIGGTAGASPSNPAASGGSINPGSSNSAIVNGVGTGGGSQSGSTVSSSSDGRPAASTATATSSTSSSGGSATNKESRKAKNLESYVKFFNHLCYIVSSDVCKATKKKLRVRYVEYWIEVAKECFNIGNFNSLMAIITGLNILPVLRMKKTWAKVNCDLLTSLEQHMDPSSNFASYRSLLKSVVWHTTNPSADARAKTVIPFFSLLIKDLYFLHQGCASRLPNGHINFEKCWQLAKQVTEVMTWQQVQCPFPKVPTIVNSIQSIPVLSENALLLASFECEPPETAEEKERLKQLQEEANLLLQMTNEVLDLVLPPTSSSNNTSELTFPSSYSVFQPTTSSQPHVFVTTTTDSTVPIIVVQPDQTTAQIKTSQQQQILISPLGPSSSSSCGNCEIAMNSSQEDKEEDQNNESHFPPPPFHLSSPS